MHHNPWGNDDLMDVNADQDDWSKDAFTLACVPSILMFLGSGAFESAPTPAPVPVPGMVVDPSCERAPPPREGEGSSKIAIRRRKSYAILVFVEV